MALRDVAEKFNNKHEAAKKAEKERLHQSELRLRRLFHYSEFWPAWFQDLTLAIDRLIVEFNDVTEGRSKLKRVVLEPYIEDCIALQFIEASELQVDQLPTAMLRREKAELKISLVIGHSKFSYEEHYQVMIKNFESLRVRISEVKEIQSLGEGFEFRDRETGKTEYGPTFETKKVRSVQELDANEFADHVLSTFAEKMLSTEKE